MTEDEVKLVLGLRAEIEASSMVLRTLLLGLDKEGVISLSFLREQFDATLLSAVETAGPVGVAAEMAEQIYEAGMRTLAPATPEDAG